jgi:hypothetical protein
VSHWGTSTLTMIGHRWQVDIDNRFHPRLTSLYAWHCRSMRPYLEHYIAEYGLHGQGLLCGSLHAVLSLKPKIKISSTELSKEL